MNKTVAALRALTIDQTNRSKSGHPGTALDAAPMMYALYRDHLKADPKHPHWINRDRLIYSSGHATPLIYGLIHVAGYDLPMEEIVNFRQLGALTPGHPEADVTPGVDCNAGPLGMGVAQALGMAMAEATLAARYPEGSLLMDHYTYCLAGEGCLEEGVAHEAIQLAGEYKLNKFILIYDANGCTLDGPVTDSTHEDIEMRFKAVNWNVLHVQDGEDIEACSKALEEAKHSDKPTVIILHTIIGYGAPTQGTSAAHGTPLGEEGGKVAKDFYGVTWPEFSVPEECYEDLASTFAARGEKAYEAYEATLKEYEAKHPEDYKVFCDGFSRNVEAYMPESRDLSNVSSEAGRASSGEYMKGLLAKMPFTFGGSADVAGSTKTSVKGVSMFTASNYAGRDLHWGIREFAMTAAQNGMLLHGGLLTYVSTFFVFSDYAKSALRMAALEKVPGIYVLTHDSLAVGEDGPTHQPIEQLAMLRATPNFDLFRPCDAREAEAAWEAAVSSKETPTALVFTRQNLPTIATSSKEGTKVGAYLIYSPSKEANLEIIATGSEVSLAIEASKLLEEHGIYAEVISMPSMHRFDSLCKCKKAAILRLPYEQRVSLEMASTFGWGKYAPLNIGVDTFGCSGKDKHVMAKYGFTAEEVAKKILAEKGE